MPLTARRNGNAPRYVPSSVFARRAADAETLVLWLRDHAVARTRDPVELAADTEARCRALRIEPPTSDRFARIVRAAIRAYEDRHIAAVHARLTPGMRVSWDR